MTDTAEYWADVKRKRLVPKFLHVKGLDCGHFHVVSTDKLIQVDCYACIKIINQTPELKQRLDQAIKSREDLRFRFGKCECGSPMCERVNKSNGIKFLGCSNYPKCRKTAPSPSSRFHHPSNK